VFFLFYFQNFSVKYKNGQKNVQFSFSQKSFAKFIVVFFDETEKRGYDSYFGDVYIYGDKKTVISFILFQ
jgi:hypothetical protein